MRNFFKILLISTCVFVLTSCTHIDKNENHSNGSNGKDGPRNLLYSLEVYSLAQNDKQIYHMRWPNDYYVFSKEDGGGCKLVDLENAKKRNEITEEEFAYFVEYVSSLQPELWQEGAVHSYRIALFYYDENGEDKHASVWGYDTFPAGFEEFIEKCNEIAGGNYLTTGEELQEISPTFLTEVFGVTDEDVRGGRLQDVIDTLEMNMYNITSPFSMRDKLDAYYASTKEAEIAPFRPVELYQEASEEEEYNAFAEAYLASLGEGWEEVESNQNYLRYFRNREENRYFYLGRTIDLDELNVQRPGAAGEWYSFALDAHMEGMLFSMDFVYSRDKKFMLLYDQNDPDMILPFVELIY